MKCLLLGAGYATRLYPLTQDRPKPLLPVGGIPILERTCTRLLRLPDLDRIFLVTNHRFASHYYRWLHDFEDRTSPKVPVEIFDDMTTTPENRLGAIGDIDFVIRHAGIEDDLMVIAGDNLILFDLAGVAARAKEAGSSVACVKDIGSLDKMSLYGTVEVDAGGKIISFEEKPATPRSTLASIGVYHFRKAHVPLFRRFLEDAGGKDAPGYYIHWLYRQVALYAHVIEGDWFDIGDLDSYNQADRMMSGPEDA